MPLQASRWLAAAVFAVLLAGCATQTRRLATDAPDLPERIELSNTPFYPQTRHQCGPAALATVLTSAGFAANPQTLEAQVYLPQREGALQAEMLAASRRQGALALPIPGKLAGLLAQINAGTPIVVLQNLGLSIAPRWHYAVVIGYDKQRSEVILRSGERKREVMTMRSFEATWERSGFWGMVVLKPGQLPLMVERNDVEKSLALLEKYASAAALLAWYDAASRRWPDSLVLLIGLGNSAYAMGHLEDAEQAFRAAAERHPNHAVALNNLATVLQQRGHLHEALETAERAVALGGEWLGAAQATRDAIRVMMSESGVAPTALPSVN